MYIHTYIHTFHYNANAFKIKQIFSTNFRRGANRRVYISDEKMYSMQKESIQKSKSPDCSDSAGKDNSMNLND
jgi:hypothetical protein